MTLYRIRISFHTSHIHFREVEWCARLHQRANNQDREVHRGDKENRSCHCEGIWCFQSTVHKDLTERLPEINPDLANEVKEILDYHKSIRHLRGGEATKLKYKKMKFSKESLFSNHNHLLSSAGIVFLKSFIKHPQKIVKNLMRFQLFSIFYDNIYN